MQLQVPVIISQESLAFLRKNSRDGDVSATLAGWTSYWLDNQARGGILLEPADHDGIAEANGGKRFKDSRSLTAAILRGLNRDEGGFSFRISIDPSHVQPLKEQAEISNMTTEELLNGVVNQCFTNGWLWALDPVGGRSIPFTQEMIAATAAACGKHGIDSSDISGLLAEDRFLPVSRTAKTKLTEVTGKRDVMSVDVDILMDELASLRKEVVELRKQPVAV